MLNRVGQKKSFITSGPGIVQTCLCSFIHSAVYVSIIKSLYHFFIQNTCSNPSVGMAHRGNSKDGPQPMLNEDAR